MARVERKEEEKASMLVFPLHNIQKMDAHKK